MKILAAIMVGCIMVSCLNDKSPLEEGVSKLYRCPKSVEDKESAATCFNSYFQQKTDEIQVERDKIPEHILELHAPVTKNNIVINNGQYLIDRNGYGTPYFIKDSVVYMEHG